MTFEQEQELYIHEFATITNFDGGFEDVLGVWSPNLQYDYEVKEGKINIKGTFDLHIWNSKVREKRLESEVFKTSVSFNQSFDFEGELLEDEILALSLPPTVINCGEEEDGLIVEWEAVFEIGTRE